MDSGQSEWLKLQYEEGARIVRYWIGCRYKILQFVGYFNAAVLTFGFSQGVLLSPNKAFTGVAICLLSIFVALMGLATEFSTASYNSGYFEELRGIEAKFRQPGTMGLITGGKATVAGNLFHKVLPVHRAHKIFYMFLLLSWVALLLLHVWL